MAEPEIALEAQAEVEVPEALPDPVIEAAPEPLEAAAAVAVVEPPTDPTPPVLEADDDEEDIEIVDELSFDEVIDESPAPQSVALPASDNPFIALTQVLESVARASGAGNRGGSGVSAHRAGPGARDRRYRRRAAGAPRAGRGLAGHPARRQRGLRGVRGSLDEWSSIAVARCLGEMARADGLRRELRRRGVAAFGLIIEAA